MTARKPKPPKSPPETLSIEGLPDGLTMYRLTSYKQCQGSVWAELMEMPYISKPIMRGYLRTFKQGWRTGAVCYVMRRGSVVAMGLRLTVKPVFQEVSTHVVAYYVMPAFRREGLGKKLHKALEEAAPGRGRVWHYDHDERSHGFYSHLGVAKAGDVERDEEI